MPTGDTSSKTAQLELEVLRRLLGQRATLGQPSDGGAASKTIATLNGYNWSDSEHQVVFEAFKRLPGRSYSELREQLPAQATRMGFPDVNWRKYFTPEDLIQVRDAPGSYDGIDTETLVAQLCAITPETAS